MNRHSQKGSALLIVLGFLSFMVVSAVAFAIWMRTERLPSSALRRAVVNRYLVKAALAQAMSRLDDAIRSHPYPGAWYTNVVSGTEAPAVYRDKNNFPYDLWEARVFMPPDPEGSTGSQVKGDPHYAPVTKTVSVLNLEALGYLPPPLINDVRLLARSSWAAKWDYFNFDAGRYAFCAVNVSDMLDINKIAADSPRTSAAVARFNMDSNATDPNLPPPSRFSLAYLFRGTTDDASCSDPRNYRKFDKCLHTDRKPSSLKDVPIVSLMDYNLAVGDSNEHGDGGSPIQSPFYLRLCGVLKDPNLFYGVKGPNNSMLKGYERQPFITDSWFPPSNIPTTTCDLSQTQNQPFSADKMNGNPNLAGIEQVLLSGTSQPAFWETMMVSGAAFCFLDWVSLFDYLDVDDVPVSLALPCVERVPMITALGPSDGVNVEFTPPGDPVVDNPSPTKRTKTYEVKIKITPPRTLYTKLLFPFRDEKKCGDYKVQAFARLVFLSDGTDRPAVFLRDTKIARNFRPLEKGDWTSTEDPFTLRAGSSGTISRDAQKDCLLLTLQAENPSYKPNAVMDKTLQECFSDVDLTFRGDGTFEQTILTKIETYKVTPKTDESPEKEELEDTSYQILLCPFGLEGQRIAIGCDDAGTPQNLKESDLDELCEKYAMYPCLMTWVRVEDNLVNKTVDMVPATFMDDRVLNEIKNDNSPRVEEKFYRASGSYRTEDYVPNDAEVILRKKKKRQMPILHFLGKADQKITYADAKKTLETKSPFSQKSEWQYNACYAVDPRFNWAPENWWFEEGMVSSETWRGSVFSDGGILDDLADHEFGDIDGRGDRAKDPFLFVSNQGYLQSVGELAFLPHLSLMRGTTTSQDAFAIGDELSVANKSGNDGDCYDGLFRTKASVREIDTENINDTPHAMPCALAAWKSYQNYRTNPDGFEFGANLYRRGLINGAQGFYVNPFTQSREVMLAAFANTPLNYWVAGTNDTVAGKKIIEKFDKSDTVIFDADDQIKPDRLADYMMHRFYDLACMIKVKNNVNLDAKQSYIIQNVWADLFDALDWAGRRDVNVKVEQIYKELKDRYYQSGSSKSSYEEMYKEVNAYGDLNSFLTDAVPIPFELDVSRAAYGDEYADPLRYYLQNKQISHDSNDGDKYVCDIDRQFLHSYWRDCFANRQQLFLIFVRAESTALGGTGEGTPAQQGGRAVALVWRDPEAPTGDDVFESDGKTLENNEITGVGDKRIFKRHPHKMRVLFYRQFD